MSSLNKAMIIGNLGSDPEVRYTQSNTAVANFSVATQNKYKDKNGQLQTDTEWHRIVAWGRTAEIAQEYLRKGSRVYIEGSMATKEWEDKEGVKRYTHEITAYKLIMLDGRPEDGQESPRRQQPPAQPSPAANIDDSFDDMDDDLPF